MRVWSLLLLVPLGVGCIRIRAPEQPATPRGDDVPLPVALPTPASPNASASFEAPASFEVPAAVSDPLDTRALYDALPLPDTFAAWQPSAGEVLAALVFGTDAGDAILSEMAPEFRVSVLRAGLRLPPSETAWLCARELEWRHMDVAESRVAVLHIVNAVCDPSIDTWNGEFWSLLECFGAADIPQIHEWMEGMDPALMSEASDNLLHKVTHGEHLGLVADFLLENGVADPASDDRIWLVCQNSDQHREAVARCFVGDAAIADPVNAGSGLPPGLRASMRALLAAVERDGSAPERYRNWVGRWLRDALPSNTDAALLLRLDDADLSADVVRWSMRHLTDAATEQRLRERASAGPWEVAARAALAVRGDAAALTELRDRCTVDGVALALLLEIRPELALDRVRSVLVDPNSGLRDDDELDDDDDDDDDDEEYEYESEDDSLTLCLRALCEAHAEARLEFGTSWDAAVFAGLTDDLLAAPISGARLTWIAEAAPALWTRRVAEAAVARLGDAPSDEEFVDDEWEVWGQHALLELGAPEAFRERLRRWALDSRPRVRGVALGFLLRMGDSAAGPLLVDALRSGDTLLDDDADVGLQHLVRSDCPEVRAYLREIASAPVGDREQQERQQEAAAGLALLGGLPQSLLDSGEFWALSDSAPEVLDTFTLLALQGRGVDAYVQLLESAPDEEFWGAGDVDDPRVTSYLQRLRRERHLAHYAYATAELAIQGDPGARAEQWAALSRGLYRWCDDMDQRFATIGFDMGLVPHWAEFIEASDCQQPTARVFLDHLFRVDVDEDEGLARTSAAAFRAWRGDRPGPLVRSRLTGTFVPLPR